MLHTSQEIDNGNCDTLEQDLYNNEKLNAIIRFSEARIPVYARAVGYAVLVAGLDKDFVTDLRIVDIASRSMVSRSMTINSLKLLVDLQIFHKQEKVNQVCTYTFNHGDWLEYSTPEPKNKVTSIRREERQPETLPDKGLDNWGVSGTPQADEAAAPGLLESYVEEEPYQQPQADIADLPLLAQAHAARMESLQSDPASPWRSEGGERYWTVGRNTDIDSGEVIHQIVKQEGITVQKAVSQVVKLASEVIKIFAELKIPFKITESPVDACKKLLAALAQPAIGIAKSKSQKKPEQSENKVIYSNGFKENQVAKQEAYYQELISLNYAGRKPDREGYILMFTVAPGGGSLSAYRRIADLMNDYPNPSVEFGKEYLPWKETEASYERQNTYAM